MPLLELIDRLRSQDPADRPDSAKAALRELGVSTPVVFGEPTEPMAPPPPPAPPEPPEPFARSEPFEPDEPPTAPDSGRRRAIAILAIAAIAVALVVGLALGTGGDDEPTDRAGREQAASDQGSDNQGEGAGEEPASPPPVDDQTADVADTDGAALNDQGFALIGQGRYDEAIPVLEQAVAALEGSGDELTYGYALFNLGNALRLAGRPEEAIPILEQRLEIPNQTEAVQAELDAARADAGLVEEGSSGPGNGNAFGHEKNGKGEEGGD